MADRACKWCGDDVHQKFKGRTKLFCDSRCKERARYERRHGRPPGPFLDRRNCQICGLGFEAKTSTRLYCGKVCRQKAQCEKGREANNERAKKYRAANPEKYRQADLDRRRSDPEKYMQAYLDRRRSDPQKYRDRDNARYAKIKSENQEKYFAMLQKANEDAKARYNSRSAAAFKLSLAYTISQIKKGDLTNGDHEPE